ncbi:hypothetical protein AB8B21_02795 [Tardiphaga sp. 866_E4_N2_1]|jgi:hypothetical protein|uniref:hypothetical protein n=1 Tax=unclassified Tardiphaga TaxID=2631404 RepID=UPI003F26221D
MDVNHASPHDILAVWQAGAITWKRAMRLTGAADVVEFGGGAVVGRRNPRPQRSRPDLLDRAARLIGNRLDTVVFWQRADGK